MTTQTKTTQFESEYPASVILRRPAEQATPGPTSTPIGICDKEILAASYRAVDQSLSGNDLQLRFDEQSLVSIDDHGRKAETCDYNTGANPFGAPGTALLDMR